MKPLKLNVILSALFFVHFIFSCSPKEQTNNTETTENTTATEKTDKADNTLVSEKTPLPDYYLENAYVTNSLSPIANHGIKQLFDGDENTYWATPKGSGPDEGVMIYLGENSNAIAFRIIQPTAPAFSAIQVIQVYGNGRSLGEFDVDEPIYIDNGPKITTLFIKILRTADLNKLETVDEATGKNRTFETFDTNKSVAISEIEFLGTNDKPLNIAAPIRFQANVSASSTLEPVSAYNVMQLFDAKRDFAWAEGDNGTGVGQQITFEFDKQREITHLLLANGYQRSEQHFFGNGRAKTITVTDDSQTKQTLQLTDAQGTQLIALNKPLKTKTLKMVFDDIYKGTKYTDMVVSELAFKANGQVFMPDNQTITQDIVTATYNLAKNTPLENVLDKRFKNTSYDANTGQYHNNTIILRSDRTFVVYDISKIAGESDTETEIVSEGNWEMQKSDANKVTIRVFGKLVNRSLNFDPYIGQTSENAVRIFQDQLTITPNTIQGQRFLGKFNTKPTAQYFVNPLQLDSTFDIQMPYATAQNFTNVVLYPCAKCLLRFPVAEALVKANTELKKKATA